MENIKKITGLIHQEVQYLTKKGFQKEKIEEKREEEVILEIMQRFFSNLKDLISRLGGKSKYLPQEGK